MRKNEERQISDILSDVDKLFCEAQAKFKFYYELVGEKDKLICDIEHEIELGENDRDSFAKLARKIKKARIERREAKDVVEKLKPIVDFINSQDGKRMIGEFKRLIGEERKVERYHSNRIYVPRVLLKEPPKK